MTDCPAEDYYYCGNCKDFPCDNSGAHLRTDKVGDCGYFNIVEPEQLKKFIKKDGGIVEEKEYTIEEILKMGEMEKDNKLMIQFPDGHFINHVTTWLSSITDGYYEYQVTAAL